MSLKKDKEKVLDEVWTEDRIRSFLDVLPPAGVDADYHMLLKAYQSMRADDFAIFVEMFTSAGRHINNTGPDGKTVMDIIAEHRHGKAHAAILTAASA
ncbi:MAG: PA4642 family protein [Pseudomonadales bacterium]